MYRVECQAKEDECDYKTPNNVPVSFEGRLNVSTGAVFVYGEPEYGQRGSNNEHCEAEGLPGVGLKGAEKRQYKKYDGDKGPEGCKPPFERRGGVFGCVFDWGVFGRRGGVLFRVYRGHFLGIWVSGFHVFR